MGGAATPRFWIDDRVIDQYGPLLGSIRSGPMRWPPTRCWRAGPIATANRGSGSSRWPGWLPPRSGRSSAASGCWSCWGWLRWSRATSRAPTSGRVIATPCSPRRKSRRMSIRSGARWPAPVRPMVFVSRGANRRHVADARPRLGEDVSPQPTSLPVPPAGCRQDTTPGVVPTPTPRRADTTPGVALTPQEGTSGEESTRKEIFRCERRPGRITRCLLAAAGHLAVSLRRSFVIPEIGLTNRQVWAVTLGELARRGDVGRTELRAGCGRPR